MEQTLQTSKMVTEKASPLSRRVTWYIFGVMFSINLLNYLDRYIFSSIANTVAKELHFGLDGIGFIASAFLIVYTVFTLPLGFLADNLSKKRMIAFCTILWSISTVFSALANNFLSLFCTRMLLGIGEAGYYPAGTALLSQHFPSSQWGKVLSWWNVGTTVGLMTGFILGGMIVSTFPHGWRLAFLFSSIPGLLLGFLVWKFPTKDTETQKVSLNRQLLKQASIETIKRIHQLLHIRSFVMLTAMQVFAFFFLGVTVTFMPTYLQQKDAFHLDAGTAGLYAGLMVVVAGVAGTVLGGILADSWQKRFAGAHILICGAGFLLGALFFAIAMLSSSFLLFSIFLFLTLFCVNLYNGPAAAATQQIVSPAMRSSALALSLVLAHFFGDAFAPSIIGIVTKYIDPTHGQHFILNSAGQDLRLSLLAFCPIALFIAGSLGIWGTRFAAVDQENVALPAN
ncbi:spinster family MFS transporter [Dictyobacter arantiisoli]|uniref:MFS transporter n=1 Tax=Dictyobacter arantiisoli TaxID=2014874 RepID=A0A5A5T8A9_9CHLR|nr:MFS transporter [Dictyobacter arantiisoli]GCF07273.1 MFS transporter [Dictyobacter arantiisoli]